MTRQTQTKPNAPQKLRDESLDEAVGAGGSRLALEQVSFTLNQTGTSGPTLKGS